jgi:diacylglycerol kinase (ATP)
MELPYATGIMKITFIANPTAGRGRAQHFFDDFLKTASEFNETATIHWTERPGHATELAAAASLNSDVVCAVGGDGTVHEVANGLIPNPVPLVVIPSGSGNDFAAMFPCPENGAELQAVISAGMGAHVDVIECGGELAGRYSVNSVGLGFEALVTRKSLSIQNMRGLPLYLSAAFKALLKYDCPNMNVTVDGKHHSDRARLMMTIGNGYRAGGGFCLTPDATPDDGKFDICLVEAMGRSKILTLLPKAISGSHVDKPGVEMQRASLLNVSGTPPFHVHVDGEYIGEITNASFSIVPGRLPVLCKPDGSPRLSGKLSKIL